MSIRTQLLLIIASTMVFAAVAVSCLHQVSKGALFHQLNSLHLIYSIELRDYLRDTTDDQLDIERLEKTLDKVRQQPIECVAAANVFDEFVMKQIGTDRAIDYCKEDVVVGNEALDAIEAYKTSRISIEALHYKLDHAATTVYRNSLAFEPLIEETVDFIKISSSATTTFFATAVIIAIIAMARSIALTVTKKDESERSMVAAREELKRSEQRLRDHRDKLEDTVRVRTDQLSIEVEEHIKVSKNLRKANRELEQTQSELVQSEKMASLGNLVAGVAHEINTPLGVSLTAATYLEEATEDLTTSFKSGALKKSDLEDFAESAQSSSRIISANLNRAAELVRSFKQVAVDQSSQEERRFNIAAYLDEILMTLQPRLKNHQHQINIECPPDLEATGYPGALSQVMTNLVINSLVHGFENTEHGTIQITITELENKIQFIFADDGCGMSEETCAKVFDPFFTTKRGQGGSGLGMNITYNLISQTLKGSVVCSGELGKGTTFVFDMAKNSDLVNA